MGCLAVPPQARFSLSFPLARTTLRAAGQRWRRLDLPRTNPGDHGPMLALQHALQLVVGVAGGAEEFLKGGRQSMDDGSPNVNHRLDARILLSRLSLDVIDNAPVLDVRVEACHHAWEPRHCGKTFVTP